MTVRIRISEKTGRVCVQSPYNEWFVAAAKDRGGKWFQSTEWGGEWAFDPRDEQWVREQCLLHYGTDGTTDAPLVTVRVCLDALPDSASINLCGRPLVQRKGRDWSARLGDGVVVLEGGFPRTGGSVKNPRVDPDDGTVLEVRDFPAALAEQWLRAKPDIYTVIPQEPAAPAPVDPLTAAIEQKIANINGEGAAVVDPKAEAIARIKALMAEQGITIEDLQ